MRILFVAGSVDRSEAALYAALARAGDSVEVAGRPDEQTRKALVKADVLVGPAGVRVTSIDGVQARLHEERFDVIHAQTKAGLATALSASRGLPVKITAYRGIVGNVGWFNWRARRLYRNSRISRVVCVCDAVRDSLRAIGIPPERLVTVYKGHDPAWYEPSPREALVELGIPPESFVVACVASMRPRKGVPVLVEAVGRLRDRGVHLLLVGDVRDKRIERVVRKRGLEDVVHLTGFRDDAAALAGACDAFVMPSLRREGLPRSVIEAMAQRIPPVVTNVGGLPELIVDGESGLVVPPNDPDALARAIQTLLDDASLRSRLGQAARQRIETHFHVRDYIQGMSTLFREVLKE